MTLPHSRGISRLWMGSVFAGLLLSLCSQWGCAVAGRAGGAAVSTAPQAPAVWSGKVTQADGAAVAGAMVEAYAVQSRYEWIRPTLHSVGQCSTRADGIFAFDVRQNVRGMVFVARKAGLSLGWSEWYAATDSQSLDIRLEVAKPLAGRVIDAKGQPAVEANVCISLRSSGEVGPFDDHKILQGLDALATTTDTAGRFEIRGLPTNCVADFQVSASGHGLLETLFQKNDGYPVAGGEVELTLPAAGTVEAIVVAKDTGQPIADAPLALWARGRILSQLGEAVPGELGRYRWKNVPPGMAEVVAALPLDGCAMWVGKGTRVEISAGQTVEAKIELVRGQVVEITAADAQTGQPVKSFAVSVWGWNFFFSKGRSDKTGVARLSVIPGAYQIGALEADGYGQDRKTQTFTASGDKATHVKATVRKMPRYHGVVRDSEGKPAPGVAVRILMDEASTTSDASGAFELSPQDKYIPVRPEAAMVLRSEGRDLAAAVPATPAGKAVDVTLRPGYTWQPTITDEQGQPIAKAQVTAILGHANIEIAGGMFTAIADAGGRAALRALPAGVPLCLRVQAAGFAAQDVYLPAKEVVSGAVRCETLRMRRIGQGLPAPKVQEVAVPRIPGDWAAWGATGRDDRGHIWFATTAHPNVKAPTAHLFEIVPTSNEVIGRGDVVASLKATSSARRGDQQMKIHTKMYQLGEFLYFASNDEEGWDVLAEKLPTYGGHLWRLRLSDYHWEHLKATPEALMAVAVGSGKVYSMGYWGHVLYQFDPASKRIRKVKVGSLDGHISRNIVADRNGHVYVPRITRGRFGAEATLVEYDTDLKEVGHTPLRSYFNGYPGRAHGITALQSLPDGSIAILTNSSYLTIVEPQEKGPAKVRHVGWFHPDGPHYAASLFADPTGRFLMGAARRGGGDGDGQPYDWVVYDLKTGMHYLAPFERGGDEPSLSDAFLYGSQTKDDLGRCYIAGGWQIHSLENMRPIVLQVTPGPLPGDEAR